MPEVRISSAVWSLAKSQCLKRQCYGVAPTLRNFHSFHIYLRLCLGRSKAGPPNVPDYRHSRRLRSPDRRYFRQLANAAFPMGFRKLREALRLAYRNVLTSSGITVTRRLDCLIPDIDRAIVSIRQSRGGRQHAWATAARSDRSRGNSALAWFPIWRGAFNRWVQSQ